MPVRYSLFTTSSLLQTALVNVSGARIAAVCDANIERAEAVARRHKADFGKDPRRLITAEACDAAIIGEAAKRRGEIARLCSERSMPFLLEMPPAPERAAAQRIDAALKSSRTLCAPVLPLRHSEAATHLKKLVAKETPLHFAVSCSAPASGVTKADAGEYAALFQGLDALRHFGGEVGKVATISAKSSTLALAAEMKSGATATVFARAVQNESPTLTAHISLDASEVTFDAQRVTLISANHTTTWNFSDTPLHALLTAFNEAVRTGKRTPLRATWPEALKTHAVWLAALSSAKSGKTVGVK